MKLNIKVGDHSQTMREGIWYFIKGNNGGEIRMAQRSIIGIQHETDDEWIKQYKPKVIGFWFWKKQIVLTDAQALQELKNYHLDDYVSFLLMTRKSKTDSKVEDIKQLCLMNFIGNITISDEEYHILKDFIATKEK